MSVGCSFLFISFLKYQVALTSWWILTRYLLYGAARPRITSYGFPISIQDPFACKSMYAVIAVSGTKALQPLLFPFYGDSFPFKVYKMHPDIWSQSHVGLDGRCWPWAAPAVSWCWKHCPAPLHHPQLPSTHTAVINPFSLCCSQQVNYDHSTTSVCVFASHHHSCLRRALRYVLQGARSQHWATCCTLVPPPNGDISRCAQDLLRVCMGPFFGWVQCHHLSLLLCLGGWGDSSVEHGFVGKSREFQHPPFLLPYQLWSHVVDSSHTAEGPFTPFIPTFGAAPNSQEQPWSKGNCCSFRFCKAFSAN